MAADGLGSPSAPSCRPGWVERARPAWTVSLAALAPTDTGWPAPPFPSRPTGPLRRLGRRGGATFGDYAALRPPPLPRPGRRPLAQRLGSGPARSKRHGLDSCSRGRKPEPIRESCRSASGNSLNLYWLCSHAESAIPITRRLRLSTAFARVVRDWYRTPFLDRLAREWMCHQGGWDVELHQGEGPPKEQLALGRSRRVGNARRSQLPSSSCPNASHASDPQS